MTKPWFADTLHAQSHPIANQTTFGLQTSIPSRIRRHLKSLSSPKTWSAQNAACANRFLVKMCRSMWSETTRPTGSTNQLHLTRNIAYLHPLNLAGGNPFRSDSQSTVFSQTWSRQINKMKSLESPKTWSAQNAACTNRFLVKMHRSMWSETTRHTGSTNQLHLVRNIANLHSLRPHATPHFLMASIFTYFCDIPELEKIG